MTDETDFEIDVPIGEPDAPRAAAKAPLPRDLQHSKRPLLVGGIVIASSAIIVGTALVLRSRKSRRRGRPGSSVLGVIARAALLSAARTYARHFVESALSHRLASSATPAEGAFAHTNSAGANVSNGFQDPAWNGQPV